MFDPWCKKLFTTAHDLEKREIGKYSLIYLTWLRRYMAKRKTHWGVYFHGLRTIIGSSSIEGHIPNHSKSWSHSSPHLPEVSTIFQSTNSHGPEKSSNDDNTTMRYWVSVIDKKMRQQLTTAESRLERDSKKDWDIIMISRLELKTHWPTTSSPISLWLCPQSCCQDIWNFLQNFLSHLNDIGVVNTV